MARPERPWYWRERRAWYVNLNGRRVKLAADKGEAFAEWHRLAADSAGTEFDTGRVPADNDPGPSRNASPTVASLTARYLAAQAVWAGHHARQSAASLLGLLGAGFGGKCVSDVTADDFTSLARRRGWAASTAMTAKRRWAAMCNWAIQQQLIDTNPLRGLRLKSPRRSRPLVLPTPDQVATLLARATPAMRDLLEALIDTGCRPSEVFRVTAADLDGDRWRLPTGKNGKPRTVYLTERVRQRCEQLAAAHPTGPLYRMADGHEWPLDAPNAQGLFRRLRLRCGLPPGITLYSFRHLFCTDALSRGVPDSVVAELAGNTPAVLQAHYAHLRDRGDGLRAALKRLRGTE